MESIGQTNHVILNMLTDYAPRLLAKDIQSYFEANTNAREVLIIRGNKILSVSRRFVEGKPVPSDLMVIGTHSIQSS